MNLLMLRFGNIVYLAIRILDVAKFTTLTPLSLLFRVNSHSKLLV
jgi:hypothetical protein